MQSNVADTIAMMAAYQELRFAMDNGKPSPTAESALALLQRSIEARIEQDDRMLNWMQQSHDARERMKKSYRRNQ